MKKPKKNDNNLFQISSPMHQVLKEDPAEKERLKRKASFEKIKNNIDLFVICEGCESILIKNKSAFCPICNAYRFNDDPLDIVKKAEELSSRLSEQITDDDYE